ncbi:hypothetical protein GTY80_28770 [Amycolatopsis sp. SID8362]|uniref:hypothetical protein n=1 Tax=Amycolatopsis sp. SID8362 TaxID=2690346 RepID=UPI00136D2D91|nr:hypothetical protein [Amycolatopsis sp. SID8362]NED43912.1 hypothetical protein [Amycolatopsis sp. SID8362]
MAYVRTVKTASGARAVQIVHSSRRGSRDIEHIGSAHDDAALEALKAVARQRLAVGQPEQTTGWSIKKFVCTTRRYRTINIQAGEHTLTAVDPLPDDLRDALTRIHDRGAH